MTKKEKGATPFESAPQGNTSAANSTAPETPRADRLAWLAIFVAFALAGWLSEGAR